MLLFGANRRPNVVRPIVCDRDLGRQAGLLALSLVL
jgi:hypothetical protein